MDKRRLITTHDFDRLMSLMELTASEFAMRDMTKQLLMTLKEGKVVSPYVIPENIITMNSRILLKDLTRGHEAELTITYPNDAASHERRVSIFSSVGIALLGKRVGDVVSWKTPLGNGSFEILKVTYQPEMVGDYSL